MTTNRRKEPLNFWPTLYPPILTRLPQPPTISNQIEVNLNLPPSQRHRSTQLTTLQDEIDRVEWEEDQWFQSLHDTRSYGYSWLVPLGRQNTQEEDQESVFSASPRANSPPGDAAAATEGEGTDDTDMDAPDLDAAIEDQDGSGSEEEEEEDEEEEEGDGEEGEEEDISEGVNSDVDASSLIGSVEGSEVGSAGTVGMSRDNSIAE